MCGCALVETGDVRNYETVTAGPKRDTTAAVKHNKQAVEALKSNDLGEARYQSDQALIANVNYAPAHNTLGRIQYCRKNYYLAAWEFEFAIRLQPEIPEYHNNLGLVYEAAGKLSQAMKEYQVAIDLDSEDYNYVSNLTRVRIRSEERSPETRKLLEQVVFMDPRKEWKDWAQLHLNTTHLDIPAADSEFVVSDDVNNVFPPLGQPVEYQDTGRTPEASGRPKQKTIELTPYSESDTSVFDDWQSLDAPATPVPEPHFPSDKL